MRWKFIQSAESIDSNLQYVEMDAGIIYLENSNGFKTNGVSACIVFVAYYQNQLLFMWHWSPPSSKSSLEDVFEKLKVVLQTISDSLDFHGIDQAETTIYAIGGQESSYNSICVLQMLSELSNKLFSLNTKYLCKAHYEDYFDLYVLANNPQFQAVAYEVPTTKTQRKAIDRCIPAPLTQLAFYSYHLLRKTKSINRTAKEIEEKNNRIDRTAIEIEERGNSQLSDNVPFEKLCQHRALLFGGKMMNLNGELHNMKEGFLNRSAIRAPKEALNKRDITQTMSGRKTQ